MSQLLSTRQVPPHQRLAYWVDAVCNTFVRVECSVKPGASALEGRIEVAELGGLELNMAKSHAQSVRRTPQQAARYGDDCFFVSLQVAGRSAVCQDGRQALMQPGDLTIYDATRPFELHLLEPFKALSLKLPRPLLRERLRDAEELTAMRVPARSGTGELFRGIFRQAMAADSPLRTPQASAAMAEALRGIVVAGLCTLPAARARAGSQLAAFHVERIKQIVRRRLHDDRLCVAAIAAELGLSPAHVHRLFQRQPQPLTEYIWLQRLEACRADLALPRNAGCSIGEIAFARGYNSAAHFSRAFRKRYGVSPREWRRQAACDQPMPDPAGRRAPDRRD